MYDIPIVYLILCIFTCLVLCKSTDIEEIKKIFESNSCIEGSLSALSANSAETYLLVNELNTKSADIQNVSLNDNKHEKSAMIKLHELAQHNDIKYFYKLEKEEGPPHNKLFTVSLTLGEETFLGEGTTLKKAQHSAANTALLNTDYEPSQSSDTEKNIDALTPTVLLNNLGAKLGRKITYYLIDKDKKGTLDTNLVIDGKLKKSYLQKLNESLYSDHDMHIKRDEAQSKGPFRVMVEVGEIPFYGISYTIQSARHQAATKAIDHLIREIQEGNSVCLKGDTNECKQVKANIKSPISLVYEAAELRGLDIEFEIIREEGPSHKKIFVTQCKLSHLITTGEGKSKKESKRIAAMNMLEKLSDLPEVPQEVVVKSLLKDKKKSRKKRNKVLRTKFDMVNMHVDNFIESVLDSVSIYSTKTETSRKSSKPVTSNTSKQTPLQKSNQDKFLEVSNLLNFEVQFVDMNDKDEYFSILSLHINPHHICLGRGLSTKIARNKAAGNGLKLLQGIPLDSHFGDKKHTPLESDIKEKIYSLLYQDQDMPEEK